MLNPISKNVHFQWKRMKLTNLISDKTKLRFLRKIEEVQPICPVTVSSYRHRRQNNIALHTILLYFSKFSIKMKTNKQQQKTNKRYQNLKNNKKRAGKQSTKIYQS